MHNDKDVISAPNSDGDRSDGLRVRDTAKRLQRTRTLVKDRGGLPEAAIEGYIVTSIGPQWLVWTTCGYHVCNVSGSVDCEHKDTIVTVGDDVWLIADGGTDVHGTLTGTIVKVGMRRTLLSRKAAGRAQREQVLVANVDQLAIVVAAANPDYNKRLIDRYLIAADKGDVVPFIVINKCDLADAMGIREMIHEDLAAYRAIGLDIYYACVPTGEGIDEIRARMAGVSTMVAGPSGTGKSSLINSLTDARLAVGSISRAYSKGRHTTTGSVVVPLPGGGSVVDSPGIREFAVWQLDASELPFYFEEFSEYSLHCKFQPCSHMHEPGCAVRVAVESGLIDADRYDSYCLLRHEVTSTPIPR
jgi:ribosome biogenesis GTPase